MYLRDVAATVGTSSYKAEIPDNGPRAMKAVWSLFAFATVFILLRLYSKARRRNTLWWDDYVLLASWIFFFVACVQLSINIRGGFGRPGNTLDPDSIDRVGLGSLVVGTGLLLATPGSKTSFAITLGRISGPRLTAALWCAAISMNVSQVTCLVVQWTQCTPLKKSWNPVVEGICLPVDVNLGLSMGSTAYSGLVDLGLAITPWIVLSKVKMKRREKIGVCLAMSMGVLAAATAFAKVPKLQVLASTDFTLDGADLIILASAEIALTMVAASMPMLRTLVCDISASRAKRQTGKSGSHVHALGAFRPVNGGSGSGNGIATPIETDPASHVRHGQPLPAELRLLQQQDPAPSQKLASYGSHSRLGSGGIVVETRELGAGDGEQRNDDSARQSSSSKGAGRQACS